MDLIISVKLSKGDGETAPESTISNYNVVIDVDDMVLYNSILKAIVELQTNE